MKDLQVGDIYLNTLSMDLWILNVSYEKGEKVWVLNCINTEFEEKYDNVTKMIYIGNIYDLTKKQCKKAIKGLNKNGRVGEDNN